MKKMVLSLLVDNTSGVLSRVSGMFSRRGYNIDSLSVGVTVSDSYAKIFVFILISISFATSVFICGNSFINLICVWGVILSSCIMYYFPPFI